jgi:2,3-dihydroxybenzoate-AMP ligase
VIPLRQTWPDDLARRYREKGYWRGETFSGFLRQRAAERPDAIAIVDRERRWSYAELLARAEAAAAGYLRAGLKPGDRVVVQLPNIAEFFSAVFGLFRAGMIPLYALPAHRITEIAHFARKAEAVGYVIAERHDGFDYRDQARALQAEVPAVAHVVVVTGDAAEFTPLATERDEAWRCRRMCLPPTSPSSRFQAAARDSRSSSRARMTTISTAAGPATRSAA